MKKLLFVVMLLISFVSVADTGTENLLGAWGTVILQGKFSDSNALWYAEGASRATDSVRGKDNDFALRGLIGRAALGYQLSPNDKVYLGYAYQWGEPPYGKFSLDEHRIYQQYDHKETIGKDSLSFRTRLEERNIEQSEDTAVRFRQQIKYSHPINKQFSFVASDEAFVNVNTVNWGPYSGFDQNRGFVGVGYKFNDNFRTEIGYMNQFMNRPYNHNDRMAHILNITLYGDFI